MQITVIKKSKLSNVTIQRIPLESDDIKHMVYIYAIIITQYSICYKSKYKQCHIRKRACLTQLVTMKI
jgi:hypothetical protein